MWPRPRAWSQAQAWPPPHNPIQKPLCKSHGFLVIWTPHFGEIHKKSYAKCKVFEDLEPLGVLEFARSGRVSITRPMKELSAYLKEMEEKINFNNN